MHGILYGFLWGRAALAMPAINAHGPQSSGDWALVIVNDQYQNLPKKPEARVDAEDIAPYLLEKRKLPPTHLRRLDNASETQIAAAVQDLIQPGLEFLWIFYYGATTTDPRNQTPLLLGPQAPLDLAAQYKTGLSTRHLLNISIPNTQLILNGQAGPEVWATAPAGIGRIGSETGYSDEKPPWYVEFKTAFEILATEVTQGQWQAVKTVFSGLQDFPAQDASCMGADCPVVNVNWSEARAYCHAIGGELPTETQWEYAAHAGTETDYYWGDKLEDACGYGNVADIMAQQAYGWSAIACNDGYAGIAPVAQYLPNNWGLYDTAGNVWEWMANEYTNDYSKYKNYSSKSNTNNVIDYVDFGLDSVGRGIRGGSFSSGSWLLRPAGRGRDGSGNWGGSLGFRCVRGPARQPS